MKIFGSYCKIHYFCTRIKGNNLNGVLVQLVRIHACHAWGHGFESRTHRKINGPKEILDRFIFYRFIGYSLVESLWLDILFD